jgi:hypothetical protein
METPQLQTTPTSQTSASMDIASSTPQPQVIPSVSTSPTSIMADGGMANDGGSGGGIKSFFDSLNWMEVGFAILGVASLSYVIYYYRFKLQQDKMINNELQRQIDEIKMNVQSVLKEKYKKI